MSKDFPNDDLAQSLYGSTRRRVEALWYAAEAGDVNRVEEVLDAGYHDVNGGNYWQTDIDPRGWRRTPLHAAALGGHVALAKYLLEHGVDVDPRTKYDDTPCTSRRRPATRNWSRCSYGTERILRRRTMTATRRWTWLGSMGAARYTT